MRVSICGLVAIGMVVACGRGAKRSDPSTPAASAPASRTVGYEPYKLGTRINFRDPEVTPLLTGFWSSADVDARWTVNNHATLRLKFDTPDRTTLHFIAGPYLAPGKLNQQRVEIKLNDKPLTVLTLDKPEIQEFNVEIPAGSWKGENTLSFDLPLARAPITIGAGAEDRVLGISITWLEINPA